MSLATVQTAVHIRQSASFHPRNEGTDLASARKRENGDSGPDATGRGAEQQLVWRATRGDAEAQNTLFERYRSRLYRLALRLLHSKEDAEDAVQDAMLSAFRNIGSFEGRSLFSTWLTRIVVNAALVKMRRQRARPELLFLQDASPEEQASMDAKFVDSRPDPEQAYAGAETRLLVEDALEDLSPSIRFAFQLRELQDLSNAEAAEVAGVELGAFKSRISRARSQLAQRFSPSAIAPLQKPYSIRVPPLRRTTQSDQAQAYTS
jgi:RNA polymerase sigma-70 factor, ECF subfamily